MLLQPLARHPDAYLHRPGGPVHVVPTSCGSGLVFSRFPCVFLVLVTVPPGSGSPAASSLLPGTSTVVHTHWPFTFSQPAGGAGLAANAGAAVATIIMAATRAAVINKLMRLITLCILSLPHPPNGLALKPSQVRCVFAGAGRVVCASTSSYKQASCPLPVHEYFVSPNLGSSLPSPSRSPFSQKTKPATGPLVPCSRLHHWLPLSLVPIFTGQSS